MSHRIMLLVHELGHEDRYLLTVAFNFVFTVVRDSEKGLYAEYFMNYFDEHQREVILKVTELVSLLLDEVRAVKENGST